MTQINLQIRIPAEMDMRLGRIEFASKSDFVRQAIMEKLHRLEAEQMEKEWIKALKKEPKSKQSKKAALAWLEAEEWGPL
ncbi:MAG: hypothetical protein HY541_09420 [Deltaproteobacteria bacterium]|nr:hypothetical protein [Deltaproteobacteria bacterium]